MIEKIKKKKEQENYLKFLLLSSAHGLYLDFRP